MSTATQRIRTESWAKTHFAIIFHCGTVSVSPAVSHLLIDSCRTWTLQFALYTVVYSSAELAFRFSYSIKKFSFSKVEWLEFFVELALSQHEVEWLQPCEIWPVHWLILGTENYNILFYKSLNFSSNLPHFRRNLRLSDESYRKFEILVWKSARLTVSKFDFIKNFLRKN